MRRLNKVDFPALGGPTIATISSSVMALTRFVEKKKEEVDDDDDDAGRNHGSMMVLRIVPPDADHLQQACWPIRSMMVGVFVLWMLYLKIL